MMDRRRTAGEVSKDRAALPPASLSRSGEECCDLCGGPLIELHCKLLCRRCGFMRDCSDP